MDRERWQQVARVFELARESPPAQRELLLARECAGDPELRAEVESLLRAGAPPSGFLERTTPVEAAWGLADSAPSRVGNKVGAYRIVREIQSGGMGTVWLSERDEGDFTRRAAIKIVRRGMDSAEILRRFHAERQALAGLDHPGIAQIFDGGTTDDGLPYFVMEYIDGASIDEFCDQERLGLRERLELFRRLCSALEFAHQKLVVHCDLKPSNVLVTRLADGSVLPKLVDFGIARLLDERSRRGVTRAVGALLATPEYASPEQIRGEPVTTATDVWGLGALLHELLTGLRPSAAATGEPAGSANARADAPVVLPSAAVLQARDATDAARARRCSSAEHLSRRLRGDLDDIVAMALRREPERRYASVAALSEDLRRHLESLPVAASRGQTWYRTSRFLRRRWKTLAASAAIALSLGIGALVSLSQAELAERRASTASKALAELEDIFRRIDPERGDPRLDLSALLSDAAARVRDTLADEPEALASVLETIARSQHNLGDHDAARENLVDALALLRRLAPEDGSRSAELTLLLAEIDFDRYDLEACERGCTEALALQPGHDGRATPFLARAANLRGLLADERRDFETAEEQHGIALRMRRELHGPVHADVGMSLCNLAFVLSENGDFEPSRAALEEALDVYRALEGEQGLGFARALWGLGLLSRGRGEYEQAEELLRRALELRAHQLAADHPDVVQSQLALGGLLCDVGEYAESEQLLATVLRAESARHRAGSPAVGAAHSNLATCLFFKGDYEGARQHYAAALESYRPLDDGDNLRVAHIRLNLANTYISLQRSDLALAEVEAVLEVRRRETPDDVVAIANARNSLGRVLYDLGRFEQAERELREVLAVRAEHGPAEYHAEAQTMLGEVLIELGRLDDALSVLEAAQTTMATVLAEPEHADVAVSIAINNDSALGACLVALGRPADALPLLESAHARNLERRGPAHPRTRRTGERLMRAYDALGRAADAQQLRASLGAAAVGETR